jgi:hypothetical protein
MTLEEMEKDPRNRIKADQVVCDPCQEQVQRRPEGWISGYCKIEVHNPRYCPMPELCGCECHTLKVIPNSSGTELGAPNLTELVKQQEERKGFGMSHRSDICWQNNHTPSDCKNVWCDCWCHKGEHPSDRATRATKNAMHDIAVKVGSQIGHKIWMTDEEGRNPRQVIILPSGEIMEIQ